jgi:hypothetical protein
MRQSLKIMNQTSLRTFIRSGEHGEALKMFEKDMRAKSVFVHFTVLGKDLPLKWNKAVALQK